MKVELPLSEVPTRVLMGKRRYSNYGDSTKPSFVWSRPGGVDADGNTFYAVCFATREQVMDELNTRPHVPSGKEGKKLRQLMSKTGMTEEELRAHSKFGMDLGDAGSRRRRVKAKYARELTDRTGKSAESLFGREVVFTK